jgi:hypothetical protein
MAAAHVPADSGDTRSEDRRLMAARARKDDAAKLRYDLIPAEALDELARVYTIGAAKYGVNKWRHGGLAFGRVFAAMMRHGWAWWRGERDDPEDGQHHLASVAWCALTLIVLEREQRADDDRQRRASGDEAAR